MYLTLLKPGISRPAEPESNILDICYSSLFFEFCGVELIYSTRA